jgi:RNA polymerase sigma-70 factor (ECF subfamily)
MAPAQPDTQELVERASQGDDAAPQQLLVRHRDRLCRMVAVRLDRRLAARLDPSDIVQEALVEAARKLSDYLQKRPLPFYPWLGQITWEQLVKAHDKHVRARRRDVSREGPRVLALPDDSAAELARRLIDSGTGPGSRLLRSELRTRVRTALDALRERDREVLVLCYLEQLPSREIAEILGLSEGAVNVRHLRALRRLRGLLTNELGEEV